MKKDDGWNERICRRNCYFQLVCPGIVGRINRPVEKKEQSRNKLQQAGINNPFRMQVHFFNESSEGNMSKLPSPAALFFCASRYSAFNRAIYLFILRITLWRFPVTLLYHLVWKNMITTATSSAARGYSQIRQSYGRPSRTARRRAPSDMTNESIGHWICPIEREARAGETQKTTHLDVNAVDHNEDEVLEPANVGREAELGRQRRNQLGKLLQVAR